MARFYLRMRTIGREHVVIVMNEIDPIRVGIAQ